MTYTLLRQDSTSDSWMTLAIKQIPRSALLSGAILHDIEEPVRVILAEDRNRGGDFIERPCAIVSDRMRSALERVGVDNIQYLRASLEQSLSERMGGDPDLKKLRNKYLHFSSASSIGLDMRVLRFEDFFEPVRKVFSDNA